MGLRDFLRRRKRRKARGEIENPSKVDLPAPRPTECGASASPSISHGQSDQESESSSMQVVSSQTTYLIALSLRNVAHSYNSDGRRSVSNVAESAEPGSSNPVAGPGLVDENRSNLRSLVCSGAKLILKGVNESADAFGPLKSVAGGLCFILDHCEVRRPPPHFPSTTLTHPLANEGEREINRILGTSGTSACGIALCTCFRRRYQGKVQEK